MRRFAHLLFALALTAAASAQTPAPKKPPPGPTSTRNRPGLQWFEVAPSAGSKPLVMNLQGMETNWNELAPGEELTVTLTGPTRLRIAARIEFGTRADAVRDYSLTWSIDKEPKQRKGFKSEPEKLAFFKGKPEAIPGTRDDMVIDIPASGIHTIVISWGKNRPAGLTTRLFTEVPKPPKGIRHEPKPQHVDSWWMKIENRLRIGYGDNIWALSDHSVHDWQEHKNNDPYDKYDRIESIGDFWFTSEFELKLISPRTDVGRFVINLQITDKLYFENHRKNWDEYQASVKHRISDDFSYKVFGAINPDKYVRDFDSADLPGTYRAHAHYATYSAGARAWYRWFPTMTTSFQYQWELKDWNSNFNERDQDVHHFDLGVRFDVTRWMTVDFDFEHVHAHANSHGDEIDTSYEEFSPRLEVNLRWNKVLFGGGYRFEDRNYTTGNSRAVDPMYSMRRDQRHVWKVYIGLEYKDSVFTLEYTRVHRSSRLPGRESGSDPSDFDDAFEYDSNSLEFTWALKFN